MYASMYVCMDLQISRSKDRKITRRWALENTIYGGAHGLIDTVEYNLC